MIRDVESRGPIPPLPPPSLTWTPPLCCHVPLLSSVSTQLSIPSTPHHVSWTPTLLEPSTTALLVAFRRSFRTTSLSRISLPFWVWTSCPKRTSLPSPGPGRSRGSSHNPSRSLRSSLVTLESSSPLNRPSRASRRFLPASTITCPRSLSTWSETSQRSNRRQSSRRAATGTAATGSRCT